jgi:hypothetical protein
MSSGLVDPNDRPLPEVERRAAVLRDLLRQSGWKVTAEVADAALAQLGIPRSTLFRAVARFRRTRRASSLLPLKRGTRDGSLLLDPRIERIIEEQIERFWLKKEKPRFSALVERVHDACHVEGLRVPSAYPTPSSKPGSPRSKRRPLSPDSATKLALKLRLNDTPVSISVLLFTQIGPSLRFECKSTPGIAINCNSEDVSTLTTKG